MNIILLGPQGCGKGTQSAMIAKEFGLCEVSVGELLRKEADKKTRRGKHVKAILAQGHLVPTEITVQILRDFLKDNACNEGVILDGFPRTLDQAEALDSILNIHAVIELKLSDAESVRRLSARTQCKEGHLWTE